MLLQVLCKMVLKTREKLIDVARQLFARKGLAHTTMNDIAAASEKGRRTIYTYFKSKREIYNAVVESESDKYVEKMRRVADDMSLPPEMQLREFLLTRYNSAADPSGQSLLSKLTFDVKRTERIRRLTYSKELALLDKILMRGIFEKVFDPEQATRLKVFMSRWLLAVDWSAHTESFRPASGNSDEVMANSHKKLIEFIVNGTLAKRQ